MEAHIVVHARRPTNAFRRVGVVVDFGTGAGTDFRAVAFAIKGIRTEIASLAIDRLETAVLWLDRALSLEKR